MSATVSRMVQSLVGQHLEEAAFLWMLRAEAVSAPHYSLQDLAELDDRLEAHLDGLRLAADYSWKTAVTELAEPDPGAVFVATLLAFESGHGDKIDIALDHGYKNFQQYQEMVSALGWIEPGRLGAILERFLDANSMDYKRLGIDASVVRRKDPGEVLERFIDEADDFSKARALRAVGELKRHDLLASLQRTQCENIDCRFWSAWSTVMLGDYSALAVIQQFAVSDSPLSSHALQLALRVMNPDSAQNWLHELAQKPEQLRTVVLATGICGDPVYVPFLLTQMENLPLARLAGEAFSMITGVDLASEDLSSEWPEGFEAGPNDDPEDAEVAMDLDEDLAWPNLSLVNNWWQAHQSRFIAGTRYLTGQPISVELCSELLLKGMQRQRRAAALELALRQKDEILFNVAAPGAKQLAVLAA